MATPGTAAPGVHGALMPFPSHVPTRLADGFGLKELAYPAMLEFTPKKWVPRFPLGNSAVVQLPLNRWRPLRHILYCSKNCSFLINLQ